MDFMQSEDVRIIPKNLNGYFSFIGGAKCANSDLFKDFCIDVEMEKNVQTLGIILASSLT